MDFQKLRLLLNQQFPDMDCHLLDEVPSTSSFLKQYFSEQCESPLLCVAKTQTAGYGQRNKRWQSYESAWKFSLLVPISLPINLCHGLSSVVGLSVIKALEGYVENELNLKWPNDLWDKNGKLGGILIESVKLSKNQTWFVVGIGINIDLDNSDLSKFSDEYCHSFLKFSSSEEHIFLNVLRVLLISFTEFESHGFSNFIDDFKKVDKYKDGDSVIVYDNGTPIIGVYRGVNRRGELKIELGDDIKTYYSGSVSIRPN